ncbi:hypothetical protein Tco_0862975 [Tanacetum coccineum]
MEQYLALSRENQALGVVKPEIKGNVNFEIKSQFMRELREDTFFGNKDEDAHDHIDWVLSIVGLFNIPGVSKDAVMLRVFPFTLKPDIPANDGWKTKPPGKHQYLGSPQEGLYPKGPIPRMRPAEALTEIQTMADHSQKWHDGTTSRNIGSSSSKDGLVGCQICEGPHLDKDCPLNEEVKQVEDDHQDKPTLRLIIVTICKKRRALGELFTKHQRNSATRSTLNGEQIKTITADQETYGLNKLHGVSFISDPESDATEVLQHQLPRKELNQKLHTYLRRR